MQSRWSDADAARALDAWGKKWGETLALRTYTARLLGAESSLVLHGGGNTSAKGKSKTILGEAVDVLFIKGSGWDLATIEPPGHPAVRLEPLRKLRALDDLSDEAMVNEQRIALLDASAPNPSIECLLHAFLPFPFVDHTHADAVLALADQPDAEAICREVYGEGLVFVPYVKPGFLLAKACALAFEENQKKAQVIVLQQHGVFTFGPDARTSYERMIEAVTRAEERIQRRLEERKISSSSPLLFPTLLRRIAPILRGVLERAGGPSILDWDESPSARAFVDDEASSVLSQIGPATPDHVIRTKPWPMTAPRIDASSSDDAIRAALEESALRFGETYKRYVSEGIAARGPRKQLDFAPRVTLVPGVGVVGAGKTKKDASIAREIYAHTIDVIRGATAVGTYRPVPPLNLFDLEYWPLEQAKLGKGQKRPLDGKIALVTGAASGIGRATVAALVAAGAHVAALDRDEETLKEAVVALAQRGPVVALPPCDVTDEPAVQRAVDACIDLWGGVDVVVSNAGTAPQGRLDEDEGAHALEASMQINFASHQYVARAASRVMLAQKTGGALLFNASKAAFNPGPSFGPYAVAKAATVALMRQYAIDLGAHGIRSNAVNADRIRTRLFGDGVLEARAKARGLEPDAYFRANLLSREVAAEDVASAFVWLATAPSTTGCVVTVDGGNAAAFPR